MQTRAKPGIWRNGILAVVAIGLGDLAGVFVLHAMGSSAGDALLLPAGAFVCSFFLGALVPDVSKGALAAGYPIPWMIVAVRLGPFGLPGVLLGLVLFGIGLAGASLGRVVSRKPDPWAPPPAEPQFLGPPQPPRCPRCDYVLYFARDHRCPECGHPFSIEEVDTRLAVWDGQILRPRSQDR